MNTTNTTIDFKTKADEILKNFIKTKKIFTAYHITVILRHCGFNVKHIDIRDIVSRYDLATEGYTKTLSTTGVFPVAAYVYHPQGATNQELLAFENDIQDKIGKGIENKAIPSSLTPVPTPNMTKQVNPPLTAAPTAPTGPRVMSAIRLKSDTVSVKSDARGRVCIPAEVVRKYFKAGDKVGITATPVNLSISPVVVGGKYVTTLTVDKYDNIRINSAHMHTKGGSITVNFDDRNKTITLV